MRRQHAEAVGTVQICQTRTALVEPSNESGDAGDHASGHRNAGRGQPLPAGPGPRSGDVDVGLRPLRAGLPFHGPMMHRRLYAGHIAHIDLTADEYSLFIGSPFVDERLDTRDGIAAVVVRGGQNGVAGELAYPGSLPVVVIWVGAEFGGDGPKQADLVVGEADVDEVLERIRAAPLAARSLAVLLRSLEGSAVPAGLAMESAVYSTLQAGPEFAEWRAGATQTPDTETRATVVLERNDDVMVITLDRPHRHNAISTRLRDELAVALAVPLADPSVRSVSLRGNGPSFCSGGDLNEFGSRPDPATAHVTRLSRSPGRLIHELGDRIIVDVHGATMGGGIEMAAFAGRVRARSNTRIALPEIGLGLIPGAGGTVSLSRRSGRQRTAALALSGRTIDAATALRWGLVDELIGDD